jgi:hypothetical protein
MTTTIPRMHPRIKHSSGRTGGVPTPALVATVVVCPAARRRKRSTDEVVIKPERASCSVAHRDHSGVLGEGRDGPEGLDHGEAAPAALEPGSEKTTA